MTDPIACKLAENALDYLILAGEQATDGSPRMLKHALATLADGVELLLKARLEIEDWKLVVESEEEVSREDYEKGDFKSVDFSQRGSTTQRLMLCGDQTRRAKKRSSTDCVCCGIAFAILRFRPII